MRWKDSTATWTAFALVAVFGGIAIAEDDREGEGTYYYFNRLPDRSLNASAHDVVIKSECLRDATTRARNGTPGVDRAPLQDPHDAWQSTGQIAKKCPFW